MTKDAVALMRARSGHERYPKLLGIEVLDIEVGYAKVCMRFKPEMEDLFGMLHGGAVFSLLDEALQLV